MDTYLGGATAGSARSVVVIGAGMAGLSAAKKLRQNGIHVVVLESRERVGGRIWTDTSLGTPMDLGASWIHGRSGNPINDLAKDFGVKTVPTSYANTAVFDARGKRLGVIDQFKCSFRTKKILSDLKALSESITNDMSVAEAVRKVVGSEAFGEMDRAELNRNLAEFQLVNGAHIDDQSLWSLMRYPPGVGGREALFPNGFAQIAERMSEGLDLHLNTSVRSVVQHDDGVQVETTARNFAADAAVITLPLGVLKAKTVKFSPSLPPAKEAAIFQVQMGVLNKVVLRFPDVFWNRHKDFIEIFQNEPKPFHSFLNWWKYSGEPLLVTFAAGRQAVALEAKSDEEIVAEVMNVLRRLPRAFDVKPVAYKVTRWSRDANSYGSYSLVPIGADAALFDVLGEPFGRLFFAGEATNLLYQGTVHGAYLSGLRVADEVSEWLRGLP